jgi:hypothetical protein
VAVAGPVPLRRICTPQDLVSLFLASRTTPDLGGAVLPLHGGGERPAFLAALENSVYPPNE